MGDVSHFEPQNLALSEKNGHFMSPLKLSGDKRELSGRMAALHETESGLREGLHGTTSGFGESRRESLHEITSELAERVAERLLEGLRRAAAVR